MKRRHYDRQVGVRVSAPIVAELEAIADEQGVTVTEAARLLLSNAVMQHVMGRVATTEPSA